MAIHKLARMVLRALSYPDLDVKKNYRLERTVKKGIKAPFKPMYRLWDHKVYVDGRQILVRIYPPRARTTVRIRCCFFTAAAGLPRAWTRITPSAISSRSICGVKSFP